MSSIKRLNNYLNESNEPEKNNRDEMISRIINYLPSASDEVIYSIVDLLGIDSNKEYNRKLSKAIKSIRPEKWNGMGIVDRKRWVLANHPELENTSRGQNFIKMIVNNNWVNAKANIKNFLENVNHNYIKPLSENEDMMSFNFNGYANKTDRQELLNSIYKELKRRSPVELRKIYQTLVTDKASEKIKEPIKNYIEKIKKAVSEEQWIEMPYNSRYMTLISLYPFKINHESKSILKIISQSSYGSLERLYTLIDPLADQN